MTTVSDFIHEFIGRHLQASGIVIWYDPQKVYASVVERGWGDTPILRYEGSFLALRKEADFALEAGSTTQRLGERPERVLVYLDLEPKEAHSALVELETAGVSLSPGNSTVSQVGIPCDTSLASLARMALEDHLPEEVVLDVVSKVQAGKMTLKDLDNLIRPPEVPVELTTFYSTQVPREIALKFLTDKSRDQEIVRRNLLGGLSAFFSRHFGLPQRPFDSPAVLRAAVATHLMVTEAVVSSGQPEHRLWHGQAIALEPRAQAAVVDVVRSWRNSRDLSEAYAVWERQVAARVNLPLDQLPTEMLARVETFAEADSLLLGRVADELTRDASDLDIRQHLRELAGERREGFWAEQYPQVRQGWQAVLDAIEVFDLADEVGKALRKGKRWHPAELVTAYADLDRGWYRLDQAYRHFELTRDALAEDPQPAFTRLVSQVQNTYHGVLDTMADRMTKAWEQQRAEDRFADHLWQRHIFRDRVIPLLRRKERVAYVLVDALRYELAAELVVELNSRMGGVETGEIGEVTWEPAVGTLPSVTLLGMSALLPGAENSLGLAIDAHGSPVAEVNGMLIHNRQERLSVFKQRVSGNVLTLELGDVRDANARLKKRLSDADLIVITSQEIDLIAENMDPASANAHFQRILHYLWRMLRRLAEAGVQYVVVTADHGFLLFGGSLDKAYKVDPPGGETVKVGRRYWIGRGGTTSRAYLRADAPDLELTGDLEYAFPRGLGVFKAAGGHDHYFHGGPSLQELVIPVITVAISPKPHQAAIASKVKWHLTPARAKITSRLFRVTIHADVDELWVSPQQVRVEARVNGEPYPVSLIHASCELNEALGIVTVAPLKEGPGYQPCIVTLQLHELPEADKLELSLHDANTEALLAGPISVPIDVAIR